MASETGVRLHLGQGSRRARWDAPAFLCVASGVPFLASFTVLVMLSRPSLLNSLGWLYIVVLGVASMAARSWAPARRVVRWSLAVVVSALAAYGSFLVFVELPRAQGYDPLGVAAASLFVSWGVAVILPLILFGRGIRARPGKVRDPEAAPERGRGSALEGRGNAERVR